MPGGSFKEVFGKHLRALISRKGMTLRELGRRSGVACPNISSYCLAKLKPEIETLYKLARGLGVPMSELLPDNLFEHVVENPTPEMLDPIRKRGRPFGSKNKKHTSPTQESAP